MTLAPAVLALALAAPPPAASFAGCEATPVSRGWQYDCPAVQLRVEDHDRKPTAAYVDGLEAAAKVVIGPGAALARSTGKIAGRDAELREIAIPAALRFATLATVAVRGGTRVLLCRAGTAGGCAPYLDALARAAWRGGPAPGAVRREPPKLAVAGRAVQVPPTCDGAAQPRGGKVTCAPYFATWNTVEPENAELVMGAYGRGVEAQLESARPRRDSIPCRLEGVQTTCARLTVEGQEVRAVVLWATARVRGEVVFANCMAPGTDASATPCALLFRVP